MKIIRFSPEAVSEAAGVLKRGGVVIFPTDTVYGIGALPDNEKAIKRLFEIKKRPIDKPLQILISDLKQVDDLAVEVSGTAREMMEKYWPGPLTLIFKKKPNIPDVVTAYGPTVGLRMPDNEAVLTLIRKTGPLAATSANLSGQPDPGSAEEVLIDADLLLDNGACRFGEPSTVVDTTTDPPKILRKGHITPI